jgi:hypothetical protein
MKVLSVLGLVAGCLALGAELRQDSEYLLSQNENNGIDDAQCKSTVCREHSITNLAQTSTFRIPNSPATSSVSSLQSCAIRV